MPIAKWLYRKSDNVFTEGGFFEVINPDPALYGIATFGDADQPDRVKDRFDPVSGKRPATAQELSAAADAAVAASATVTAKQRDVLATIAWCHKQFNPAWAAMTAAQKRSTVLASADDWQALRVLVDKF